MKVTLIHNPTSGMGDRSNGKDLAAMIRAAGHQVASRSSKDENWQEALKEPANVVAVAGGDGTVAKVARLLVGNSTPLAILPTGTANNIARTVQPTDLPLSELIASWSTATHFTVDVGTARTPWDQEYFLEALGSGFFAWTTAQAKVHGSKGGSGKDCDEELRAARRHLNERLREFSGRHFHLKVDGRDLSGDYLMVEVMNIRSMGPNLFLAPQANPGDGFMNVVLVSTSDKGSLAKYLEAESTDKRSWPDFVIHRARNVELRANSTGFHLDDRAWPDEKKTRSPSEFSVEVGVQPQALEILVPARVEGD
ncbi:MAG TPA: diacylglycerol kinase family protein [Gemmataceae bacterium]|nr:diacylglycerol kinase family protein [Gemmataceae bacterium]